MRNFLHAISLSTANYLIGAAGDDVSEPDRAARIAQAFAEGGGRVALVTSNAVNIDGAGHVLPTPVWPPDTVLDAEYIFEHAAIVGGAGAAYRRDVIDAFPPPDLEIRNEDAILCQRASMLGRIAIMHQPLLRYRIHDSNISKAQHVGQTVAELIVEEQKQVAYWQRVQSQQRQDVVYAIETEKLDRARGARLLAIMDRHMANLRAISEISTAPNAVRRLALAIALKGLPVKKRLRLLLRAFSPGLYLYSLRLRSPRTANSNSSLPGS